MPPWPEAFLGLCTFSHLAPLPSLPSLFPTPLPCCLQTSTPPPKPTSGVPFVVVHLWHPQSAFIPATTFPKVHAIGFEYCTFHIPLWWSVSRTPSSLTSRQAHGLSRTHAPVPGTEEVQPPDERLVCDYHRTCSFTSWVSECLRACEARFVMEITDRTH